MVVLCRTFGPGFSFWFITDFSGSRAVVREVFSGIAAMAERGIRCTERCQVWVQVKVSRDQQRTRMLLINRIKCNWLLIFGPEVTCVAQQEITFKFGIWWESFIHLFARHR